MPAGITFSGFLRASGLRFVVSFTRKKSPLPLDGRRSRSRRKFPGQRRLKSAAHWCTYERYIVITADDRDIVPHVWYAGPAVSGWRSCAGRDRGREWTPCRGGRSPMHHGCSIPARAYDDRVQHDIRFRGHTFKWSRDVYVSCTRWSIEGMTERGLQHRHYDIRLPDDNNIRNNAPIVRETTNIIRSVGAYTVIICYQPYSFLAYERYFRKPLHSHFSSRTYHACRLQLLLF